MVKNKKLEQIELKATRAALGDALLELGRRKDIVVLTADLSDSTKTVAFSKKYPEKFFQSGVAEQNMVGMAVGLALSGKIPFVTTFAAFVPGRTLDQIRVSICYNDVAVKLASTHAGLTVGEDGATHQALEDIAVMRVLPNMDIIVPCDYIEAKKAVRAASKTPYPTYLRFGRSKTPLITNKDDEFEIGKANILSRGCDVTIVACGIMVSKSLKAADELKKQNISAEVINMHTIKPFDSKTLIRSVKKTACVVSCEEHQVNGGLGGAVSEVLAKKHPVPQEFVAVDDYFGQSGKADELLELYNLTSKDIVKSVKKVIKRKN